MPADKVLILIDAGLCEICEYLAPIGKFILNADGNYRCPKCSATPVSRGRTEFCEGGNR